MKLPNGFGTVYKLSGKRRKPYIVKNTVGWHYDKEKDKQVKDYIVIGFATTRAEGLQMLADYNNNPYDLESSKVTFTEVYEKWLTEKYPTVSKSNVSEYVAAYGLCSSLDRYKDRNPNKYDRNKFVKKEINRMGTKRR